MLYLFLFGLLLGLPKAAQGASSSCGALDQHLEIIGLSDADRQPLVDRFAGLGAAEQQEVLFYLQRLPPLRWWQADLWTLFKEKKNAPLPREEFLELFKVLVATKPGDLLSKLISGEAFTSIHEQRAALVLLNGNLQAVYDVQRTKAFYRWLSAVSPKKLIDFFYERRAQKIEGIPVVEWLRQERGVFSRLIQSPMRPIRDLSSLLQGLSPAGGDAVQEALVERLTLLSSELGRDGSSLRKQWLKLQYLQAKELLGYVAPAAGSPLAKEFEALKLGTGDLAAQWFYFEVLPATGKTLRNIGLTLAAFAASLVVTTAVNDAVTDWRFQTPPPPVLGPGTNPVPEPVNLEEARQKLNDLRDKRLRNEINNQEFLEELRKIEKLAPELFRED